MLTKTLSEAKKKQRNILIKAMNNDIGSIDSAKDSWNPAQISERAKDISYIRNLVDTWNPAQLNEALKMLDLPVIDTWNPAQIEEQRRNLVFYLAERTLTGNPITLKILGNLTPEVTGLKVTMNPIQDTSQGDPSPTNICPISGRTEVSVTRTAGEDVETKTHEYSDTIYGGTDDFVNGEGSVTIYAHTFDGTETLTSPNEGYIRFVPPTTLLRNASSIPRSSHYVGYYGALDSQPDNSVTLANTAIIQIRDTVNATTSDAYKAYLAQQYQNGTPLTIIATLATPTTIETTPEEIALLKGTNVLSTDGDSIELKYKQNF
jgi:hypothetical protein